MRKKKKTKIVDSGRHIRLVAVTLIATSANGVSVESNKPTNDNEICYCVFVCLFSFVFCFLFFLFSCACAFRHLLPRHFLTTLPAYIVCRLSSHLYPAFFLLFFIFSHFLLHLNFLFLPRNSSSAGL